MMPDFLSVKVKVSATVGDGFIQDMMVNPCSVTYIRKEKYGCDIFFVDGTFIRSTTEYCSIHNTIAEILKRSK